MSQYTRANEAPVEMLQQSLSVFPNQDSVDDSVSVARTGTFAYPPVVVVWEPILAGVEPLDWCYPQKKSGKSMVVPYA